MILLSIPIGAFVMELVFMCGVALIVAVGLLIYHTFGSLYVGLEWLSNNWTRVFNIPLVQVLLGCLYLFAKGLWWLLVKAFLLFLFLFAVAELFGIQDPGAWPLVVAAIGGLIAIGCSAVVDLKKFGTKLATQVEGA